MTDTTLSHTTRPVTRSRNRMPTPARAGIRTWAVVAVLGAVAMAAGTGCTSTTAEDTSDLDARMARLMAAQDSDREALESIHAAASEFKDEQAALDAQRFELARLEAERAAAAEESAAEVVATKAAIKPAARTTRTRTAKPKPTTAPTTSGTPTSTRRANPIVLNGDGDPMDA